VKIRSRRRATVVDTRHPRVGAAPSQGARRVSRFGRGWRLVRGVLAVASVSAIAVGIAQQVGWIGETQPLNALSTKMTDYGTARFIQVSTSGIAGNRGDIAQGVIDFRTGDGLVTTTSVKGDISEMYYVPPIIYARVMTSRRAVWMAGPVADNLSRARRFFTLGAASGFTPDPTLIPRVVRAAGRLIGTPDDEVLVGVRVRHFEARLDLTRVPDALPVGDRSLARSITAGLGPGANLSHPRVDFWVDDAGRVRRIVNDVQHGSFHQTATIDLYDFGVAVPPPPSLPYNISPQVSAILRTAARRLRAAPFRFRASDRSDVSPPIESSGRVDLAAGVAEKTASAVKTRLRIYQDRSHAWVRVLTPKETKWHAFPRALAAQARINFGPASGWSLDLSAALDALRLNRTFAIVGRRRGVVEIDGSFSFSRLRRHIRRTWGLHPDPHVAGILTYWSRANPTIGVRVWISRSGYPVRIDIRDDIVSVLSTTRTIALAPLRVGGVTRPVGVRFR
jgi:hypothetical protein